MIRQKLFLLLGYTSLGFGFAGVFLPVLPTTPFILLSAFCFSRSSDRLHLWLLAHPTFGSLLSDWERGGAIRPRAKVWSILLMNGFIGYALFFQETPSTREGIAARDCGWSIRIHPLATFCTSAGVAHQPWICNDLAIHDGSRRGNGAGPRDA